jgi:biopolymer transport protein ExbB
MNFQLYHELTFDALYACVGILVFVILERCIYLTYLTLRSGSLIRALSRDSDVRLKPQDITARDPISHAVVRYLELGSRTGVSREQLEDFSSALYIQVDKRVSARMWILDTIITGAPLLGLLGTIFGIMQTFTALAQGGVSDPAEVSRGIGLALTATAIGIATALLGLLGNNVLNRRALLLTEDFKFFCLRLTPPCSVHDRAGRDHQDDETGRQNGRFRMRVEHRGLGNAEAGGGQV